MPDKPAAPPMRVEKIGHASLRRALQTEAHSLQKIHVRIQKQLHNLEVEEKLILRMIERQQEQLQQTEQLEAQPEGDPVQRQHELQQEGQERVQRQQQQAEGGVTHPADGPTAVNQQHQGLPDSDLADPDEMEEI